MPTGPEGHSGLRKKVCVICWNENGKKPTKCVTPKEESLIQEHIIEGYLANDELMPCGVCSKCRLDLLKLSKGEDITFLVSSEYAGIKRVTRNTDFELKKTCCTCAVCKRGRMNGGEFLR